MKTTFLVAGLLLATPRLFGQLTDDFSDGNFDENPTWSGSTDKFDAAAQSLQLRDEFAQSNNTAYLSVLAPTSTGALTTWEFYARLEFAPSSSNFARFYLAASSAALSGPLNGYYIKIGGVSGDVDAVSLYRQDADEHILLVEGYPGTVALQPAEARVRVTRTPDGLWSLHTNTGNGWVLEGETLDASHSHGVYAGVYCRYTSTRSQHFFFDDILIDPLYVDATPPALVEVEPLDALHLALRFDEAIDQQHVVQTAQYDISPGIGAPLSVIPDSLDASLIRLDLADPLVSMEQYTLTVAHVTDLAGNASGVLTAEFSFFQVDPAHPGDLLVNEILFNPQTGGKDFVELWNVSDKIIDLYGLQLINMAGTANRETAIDTHFLLFPGRMAAICTSPDDLLSRYAVLHPDHLIAAALPTMDDKSGNITLRAGTLTIDSFDYDESMHHPLLAFNDGVSLERLSAVLPSNERSNWHSASGAVGFATPTYPNSQQLTATLSGLGKLQLLNEVFSPDSDGWEDVLMVQFNADAPGYVINIHVFDDQGRPVVDLARNELLGGEAFFSWDGVDALGGPARAGIYIVWAEWFAADGKVERDKKTCVLARKME